MGIGGSHHVGHDRGHRRFRCREHGTKRPKIHLYTVLLDCSNRLGDMWARLTLHERLDGELNDQQRHVLTPA